MRRFFSRDGLYHETRHILKLMTSIRCKMTHTVTLILLIYFIQQISCVTTTVKSTRTTTDISNEIPTFSPKTTTTQAATSQTATTQTTTTQAPTSQTATTQTTTTQAPTSQTATTQTTTTQASTPQTATTVSTTQSIRTGSTPLHDNTTTDNQTGGREHETVHATIELVPIHFKHVKYPLIFTLVVLIAGLSKLAFHFSHFLSSKIPESCVLIVLGVICGTILYLTDVKSQITLYQPHEFFLFLLPPIILEAAFSLHDRTFAENIGSVLLFAVVGTVVACFTIGLSLWGLYQANAMTDINCTFIQILVFSALIVAVDPVAVLAVFQEVGVNDQLYFMVFGESLLNDGVTVVLYNVLQIFNRMDDFGAAEVFLGIAKFVIVVVCGVLIGVFCGLISSFITKYTNSVKVVEPIIIFGFAYLSYVLSELFEFSGIISMVACGVLQVHYAFHNITNKSKLAVKFFAKVMATASEIVIFLFLGIVTVNPNHDWNTGFTLWSLLLCTVWRMIIVYSISFAINRFDAGRIRKIRLDEMFMISYGGLRGAVCFSLVALIDPAEIPKKNMFLTTTLFIIGFTVFIQGGTIKFLVKKLRISLASKDKDMKLNEELANHVVDHLMAGIEEVVGYTHGKHHIKERLDHIDDHFFRPRLLRNATSSELEGISHYYEKLMMKEHYKNLHLGGAKLPRVKTEIRHLDSELALDQMVQDESEREEHRNHEDLINSREEEHRTMNESHGSNVHKFFSHTMHTVRSRLHLKVHDKNMVHDNKHHLLTYLRKKHKKNKQLSQLINLRNDHHVIPSVTQFEQERSASQVKFQIQDEIIQEDQTSDDEEKENAANGRVVFHL